MATLADGTVVNTDGHRTIRTPEGLQVDYSDTPARALLEMELRDRLVQRDDLLVRKWSTVEVDARIAVLQAALGGA
jgi:hypothetical protein